jgi:hypothetical protein
VPTDLPQRPRSAVAKRSTGRLIFDVVFNGAMLISALILTFVVLVREEQYAIGQQQLADQVMHQRMLEANDEGRLTLPSD